LKVKAKPNAHSRWTFFFLFLSRKKEKRLISSDLERGQVCSMQFAVCQCLNNVDRFSLVILTEAYINKNAGG
jgi:hypothetical protein